jgi:hypothetical protein
MHQKCIKNVSKGNAYNHKFERIINKRSMKKLVMVLALGVMLGSCGGGDAAEVDVNSLDSSCACAEAQIEVLTEAKDLHDLRVKEGDKWDEAKGKEMDAKMETLEKKYREIMDKMYDVVKDAEDCPETGKAIMKLVTEWNARTGLKVKKLWPAPGYFAKYE